MSNRVFWKITYNITYYYRDRDNYPTSELTECDSITGDTLDEAYENLLEYLKKENWLKNIINAQTNAKSEEYYDIEILSADRILSSDEDFDFHQQPAFLSMVETRKKELAEEKAARDKKQAELTEEKEREQLKQLKAKYETE